MTVGELRKYLEDKSDDMVVTITQGAPTFEVGVAAAEAPKTE